MQNRRPAWKPVVVGICVFVALLHVLSGPGHRGPWRPFVTGYLIDLLLPFALYLLLGVSGRAPGAARLAWAAVMLAIGGTVEALQHLGIPVFGATFDPLALAMCALGAGAGMALERVAASRFEGVGVAR